MLATTLLTECSVTALIYSVKHMQHLFLGFQQRLFSVDLVPMIKKIQNAIIIVI